MSMCNFSYHIFEATVHYINQKGLLIPSLHLKYTMLHRINVFVKGQNDIEVYIRIYPSKYATSETTAVSVQKENALLEITKENRYRLVVPG